MPCFSDVGGGLHPGDRRVDLEQPPHLFHRWHFVIDRQHLQSRHMCAHAGPAVIGGMKCEGALNLGMRIETFMPASSCVSICSPWSAPYAWRRRRSTLRSPTWVLSAWPLITLAMYSGSAPTPPSSILISENVSTALARTNTWPPRSELYIPCRTACSTSGGTQRNGISTPSTSGAISRLTCSRDPKQSFSNSTYRSTAVSSSSIVVKSPSVPSEYRVKLAKSTSKSRARDGSVGINPAMALSEL